MRAGNTTAPVFSGSGASAGQQVANADCIMEDASHLPATDPTAGPPADTPAVLHTIAAQPDALDQNAAADDLQSTRGGIQSTEANPVLASPGSGRKSPPVEARCATNSHVQPESASRIRRAPSAEEGEQERVCAAPEQTDDAVGFEAPQDDSHVEAKVELEHDDTVLNPIIKSVEPQHRNGTAEHVLQQAPSSTIDSAAEQPDEVEGDSKPTGRRPRRAAANRKSALELVRGDSARGGARSETPRTSRTGEAAARTQTARYAPSIRLKMLELTSA
jgi:hypothetical protein